MPMKNDELCPCASGKPFGECCGPILDGSRKAATAAELGRFMLFLGREQQALAAAAAA